MKILDRKPLHKIGRGDKVYLTVWEITYEHKGRTSTYFAVGRGESYPEAKDKKPDAVVVVAILDNPGEEKRLVCTSEFRIPVGAREIGFVAGLIDPGDFLEGETLEGAAKLAAIREMREEAGLQFKPLEVSPPNLYSTAGMSNESITYVFGTATGTPSNAHLEDSEDIDVILMTHDELARMISAPPTDVEYSKSAWPIMWAYSQKGF